MTNGVAIETGTPPASQGSSSIEPQSPSQPTPRTYSEQEYNRAITSERKKQSGLDKELASLQTQLLDKEDELKGLAGERELLKADIDALASDDPNKFNLIKKERELRTQEAQLKVERKTHEERLKKAEAFERRELVQSLVGDYEGADANKLLRLCAKVSSEEDIREIADTVWTRKVDASATPEVPVVKPDSGRTSGGGIDFSKWSTDEKLVWACAHPEENERRKKR